MSYQVLARKWRPRDFSQVIGQGHVVRALTNALDTQRLHHAYLFTGTRGVGKTSLARVFAKALNCEQGVSSKPCGVCSACRELDEGRYMDLIEVDAASRTKVDETRDLLDNVQYAPSRGRYKVYLIDEVHMFSNHSFNALLKTLEEPPPHVKFLLATTDPKRLPVTILSRCLQFNLKRLGAAQLQAQLKTILESEGIPAEDGALALLAEAADGSVRDALSLLDQAIAYAGGMLAEREVAAMLGTLGTEHITAFIEALATGDGRRLIDLVRELAALVPDFNQVLGELLSLLRRIAVAQALAGQAEGPEETPAVLDLAARLSAEDCQLFYQIGLIARRDLPLAPDPQAGFEMALLRMLAFRPAGEVPAVAATRAAAARPRSADPAPAATPAAERPLEPPASLDWASIVEQLAATPLVKELARNCGLRAYDGRLIDLVIPPQFQNLRGERQIKALEAALRGLLKADVVVRLAVEEAADLATPAQQRSAAEAARQAEAERRIALDPNVQLLQSEFGATIERVTGK